MATTEDYVDVEELFGFYEEVDCVECGEVMYIHKDDFYSVPLCRRCD